jgi:hypothetical protein
MNCCRHFVIEDAFTLDEVFDGLRIPLENSLGDNITVNQQFRKLDNVPASSIIEADSLTSEGLLHVIEDAIVPPIWRWIWC